ncbi:hypothetical protein HYH03_009460 [Edaphochlamys debaryana]|uniref:Alanyl-transfer RNA synthetases family profile domain-containing protein n=1 Tax=Edaphochlamys debaryana TaxID=47281 RepID=A0A835Y740_9CHLO|nr:hypothetical protein HYH03_009460 [Edaphochlamys debaryana]|eukprot:KAG2492214.1 hypothetical protein HYH03_009460 [Edaphochlamys debaryana]
MAEESNAGDEGGLCLCQTDSYLRQLTTTVVSCTRVEPSTKQPAAAGKGKSKDKGAKDKGGQAPEPSPAAPAAGTSYEVVLAETPMFPESGGQPCDQGQLLVLGADGDAPAAVVNVSAVMWREGVLVHVTDAPLEPGCRVEARIDWERRFDHMQQHTGQHVLSAVADLLWGADTASWELHPLDPGAHAGGDYGCVSVDLTLAQMSAEQLLELEARTNAELRALRAVQPLVLDPRDPGDAERMGALRTDPCFRGSLPPPDKIKGGRLRLVQVEGLDINACGGTHVRSTGEVQLLKLVGAERTRGHTRVRFMSGGRALAALAGCLSREAALTAKLTCPPARQEVMVDSLLRDRRDGSKARKLLAAELASLLGRALALEAASPSTPSSTPSLPPPPPQSDDGRTSNRGSSAPTSAAPAAPAPSSSGGGGGGGGGGRAWAVLHRPAADLDFLGALATAALEAGPGLRALLLTADDTEPGAVPQSRKPGVEDSVEVTFLVAGDPDLAKTAGARVAEALGGRGGGRPGRYQGKAVGLFRLPGAQQAFRDAVADAGLL